MTFYAYIYRDPNRKLEPIYVGKGRKGRAYVHLTRKDKHPFTQRLQLMKREGIEPRIEIITAIDEKHAIFLEECLIQVLGRKDLGKGPLLNLTNGGEGLKNPGNETRARMSERAKNRDLRTRENMAAAQRGKKHTIDHRAKISDAVKGLPKSKETCDKLSQANKGKIASPETRAKMSEKAKHRSQSTEWKEAQAIVQRGKIHPKVVCPHCGKIGAGGAMAQFHFDKCKFKS